MKRIAIASISAGLLAVAIAAPASGGVMSPVGQVYAPKDCHTPKIEPHRIVFACADFGVMAKRLQWSEWGGEKAKGTGELWVNSCDPSCSDGNFDKYDIKLTLLNVRSYECDGQTLDMYRRAHIRFPGEKPPHANGFRSYKMFCDE